MLQFAKTKVESGFPPSSSGSHIENGSTEASYSNWEGRLLSQPRLGHFYRWSRQVVAYLVVSTAAQMVMILFGNPLWLVALIPLIIGHFWFTSLLFPKPWLTFSKALGILLAILILAFFLGPDWWWALYCLPVVNLCFWLAVVCHIAKNGNRRWSARTQLPQLDQPSPFQHWPVTIKIYSNRTLLGEDVGWIAMVEPFLHFHGRRTEFSLLGSDVSAKRRRLKGLRRADRPKSQFSDSTGLQLTWRDGQNQELLLLEPLDTPKQTPTEILAELRLELTKWQSFTKDSDLNSTFPPNFPSPERISAARRRAGWAKAHKMVTILATGVLAFVQIAKTGLPSPMIVLPCTTLLAGFSVSYYFHRQVKRADQLERMLDRRRKTTMVRKGQVATG
jgi:hypothetical protein